MFVKIFDKKFIPGLGRGPITKPISINEATYNNLVKKGFTIQVMPSDYKNLSETDKEINKSIIADLDIEKLEDYLYSINYENYIPDYEYAKTFFKNGITYDRGHSDITMRYGNYVGRSYNALYNNLAEFVVKTGIAGEAKHRVIGVASGLKTLTNDFVNSRENSSEYKILPFMLLDGINDAGLYMNSNVVVKGRYRMSGTNPGVKDNIHALMLVRYVLDRAGTVSEAKELLTSSDVNIYCNLDDKFQYMISDSTSTCIVNIINNEIIFTDIESSEEKVVLGSFYYSDILSSTDELLEKFAKKDNEGNIIEETLTETYKGFSYRYTLQNHINVSNEEENANILFERAEVVLSDPEEANNLDDPFENYPETYDYKNTAYKELYEKTYNAESYLYSVNSLIGENKQAENTTLLVYFDNDYLKNEGRYDYLLDKTIELTTNEELENILDIMKEVDFSSTYNSDPSNEKFEIFYQDICEMYDLNNDGKLQIDLEYLEDFNIFNYFFYSDQFEQGIKVYFNSLLTNKDRNTNKFLSHTVHSCAYDIENKQFLIRVQELRETTPEIHSVSFSAPQYSFSV